MIKYQVYQTTNHLISKIYIGITNTNRKNYSTYYGSNKELIQDIEVYGINNFSWKCLYEYNTREESLDKESQLVQLDEIRSNPWKWYNKTSGGGIPPSSSEFSQSLIFLEALEKNRSLSSFIEGRKQWCNSEENLEHLRRIQKEYAASPEAKERFQRYLQSPEHLEHLERLNKGGLWVGTPEQIEHLRKLNEIQRNSPEHMAQFWEMHKNWVGTPEHMEQFWAMVEAWSNSSENLEHLGRIRNSEKHKEATRKRAKSPEGQAHLKKMQEEWNNSPENLALLQELNETWNKSPEAKENLDKIHEMARKLSKEQVVEIHFKYRKESYTQKKLAEEYNISTSTIKDLLVGKFYTDIYEELKLQYPDVFNKPFQIEGRGRKKLSDNQVREIHIKYRTGNYTQKKLAEEYNINKTSISYIIRGINYKHIKQEFESET